MDKLVQSVKRFYLRWKYHTYGWRGNYASWQEAAAKCGGYDAGNILAKVKASTLKVKNGEAVYERDSILYDKIEHSWPMLTNLLWVAGRNNNRLSVLDFGGSLGTVYFQARTYLQHLASVEWSIVEQLSFVAAGQKEIAGRQLQFFENIELAKSTRGQHDVLLLSSVLPYIEKPYELLASLAAAGFPYILVTDTYFNNQPADRLTIQKVPPVYYDATYPAWFLHYEKVVQTLSSNYDMIAEFKNEQILYLDGALLPYQGFMMQLKKRT